MLRTVEAGLLSKSRNIIQRTRSIDFNRSLNLWYMYRHRLLSRSTRFGEFHYCCCLSHLLKIACNYHATWCIDFSRSLHNEPKTDSDERISSHCDLLLQQRSYSRYFLFSHLASDESNLFDTIEFTVFC